MSSTQSPLNLPFKRLRQLRTGLLNLHKNLLESERITYEKCYGRIPSKGEFFRLVIGDDWFSWLRPFSQFIVKIDETLEEKEPVTLDQVNELLEEAKFLLRVDEQGTEREKRYYQAIQRDPNIALIHAEVSNILK
ncbi:MAG: hypothetical protein P5702_17195 [Limnospira sp. PMC 1291.21]|uniref:Uncharacterized protein n=3 Tax=Limnospira TaxID=2596745 RepID=A0A9P1NZ05_9CYAN|nr:MULTISPECIES: hypothetical protein [Limnospira]AMW27370.1 hypothetical protein AP285_04575 [Arthrospira platensis YZ]EKD06639.1 hypothetical protein SPLC1_S532330 [Arthrospira platensis C1]MDC0838822.1 hypothetical protein [Limnoraphis robusta]MDY7054941.1 hypothetical protein [Limnospira fusiformis LS22]QJB26544.1 hypothetical protein HFV01_12920 [Limnospira fusiformis SAG 85.79]RAQ49082.1 hypothetical protein B9S53_00815 [Arthrospira sp. O9.13F]